MSKKEFSDFEQHLIKEVEKYSTPQGGFIVTPDKALIGG